MIRRLLVAVAMSLITLAFACSSSPSGSRDESLPPAPAATPAPRPVTPPQAPAPAPGQPPSDAGQPAPNDQMIVRTGSLSLLVNDVAGTVDRITRVAATRRGYVVSSQNWREGERLRGSITIRVAVEEFDNAMREISGMADEVVSQNTSAKDVTQEYVDLKARLQNLEATEQQLLKIMTQAQKIEDVLNVQRELTRVRGDIEQTKARMQYLERTSATSLIEVQLEQVGLVVKFTVNRRFIEPGQYVTFSPQVSGGFQPFSYQWDFGDGEKSNEALPQHQYRDSGVYSVTLKVTDDRNNTASATNADYVSVVAPPGWSGSKVVGSAWDGLVVLGQVMASILIWLGIFSPAWIVILAVVLIVRWRMRRKK